ncbi:exopolyphosphatase [Cordyceps fumosorosea ARSEF 2679]|uniref:Exopolyphosphatase n=1 Tax=Cordyceps fumosorosea (strain ARSEF 2679) TaxID=1081104 RepID=A0A162IET5_CORFA|nr:exopolyphosphatase [Cordyceps fumosorosea ARSEF 2679]OAA56125.1 exopolyphosphatase [Cordyceps fumosorosea ARSEF 2679]
MTTSTVSLKTFLAAAKEALAAPPSQRPLPLTFVVGNESADLDSLCSAVVLAYIRSHISPQRLHIPLSNLPREDLSLRIELGPVLAKADLEISDLITLSELPQQLEPNDTEWVLVDHNVLTGSLKKFERRIVGCIDHHVDEGIVGVQATPRVIETCGSCMSLVVDAHADAWRSLAHGTQLTGAATSISKDLNQLAQVALAPILVDTINLTSDHKVRPKDRRAAQLLETELMQDPDFDQRAYYDAVTAAKEDLSQLGLRDILRKDYKEWVDAGVKLGISCAVQDLDFLLEKATATGNGSGQDVLLRELRSWAGEQALDVASIMTTSNPGGKFQRHLLVWGLTDGGRKAVERFTEESSEKLKLAPLNGGVLDEKGIRYAWSQLALDASRKQVAPLLRDAMTWAGANL